MVEQFFLADLRETPLCQIAEPRKVVQHEKIGADEKRPSRAYDFLWNFREAGAKRSDISLKGGIIYLAPETQGVFFGLGMQPRLHSHEGSPAFTGIFHVPLGFEICVDNLFHCGR